MTMVMLFVLGTIVGSFLNVVELRWDKPKKVRVLTKLGGRSYCPSCRETLRWWELVPIISFFVLRGRCHRCKEGISYQYPLVELWTGLIFATIPLGFVPIFCIYIVIAVYDFKHKIIPDELVYTSIVIGLVYAIFIAKFDQADLLAGPTIFLFFASIWFFSSGRAMGFGDAKLGLSVGLMLGAVLGFSAIVLSFWIGSVVALFILGMGKAGFLKGAKGLTIKSEVPFAPFIILGTWVALVFELNLLNALSF